MIGTSVQRRDFITLLGGAAAAWPLAARAQQPAMPVIGYFSARVPETDQAMLAAFRRGLGETGYVEGRNVAIEFRWGGGDYAALPAMAADLARRQVAVIATSGGLPSARAAQAATATIPIVFLVGSDPVQEGLVASLNRPGGQITGLATFANSLIAKELGLLHDLVPSASKIGMLVDLNDSEHESAIISAQSAVSTLGLELITFQVVAPGDIETAFAGLAQKQAGALLLVTSPLFLTRQNEVVALAGRYKLPAMYSRREYVDAGGLASYGTDQLDSYRQAGVYVGRILKGEKPANLPVLQPTKFELVINLKTAKELGLTVPYSMQVLADEVIE